jgi:hypothetical protein
VQESDLRRTHRDLAGEYEAVRANDTHFVLYPGHAELDVERVISSRRGYDIVAKEGPAADVARNLSQRS